MKEAGSDEAWSTVAPLNQAQRIIMCRVCMRDRAGSSVYKGVVNGVVDER